MLRPEKAHAVLLNAAVAIRKTNDRVRYLIVGDGPERANLETLSRSLGLSDIVTFAGGRNDIPEILSALDLFVLCSDTEAFPVSILEAMAMERPVVSTDVGSVSEAVVHGTTGLLVPPGRPEALASAICELLADPARRREMGVAGRRRVQDHFSVESMVGQYQDLFAEMAGGMR
jgi:glycosyltransferase involved in cell wall biosynthesis